MGNRREEIEIDLLQLCKAVLKKLPIILLAAVILGAAAFGWALITNDTASNYKADVSIFLKRDMEEGEDSAPVYLTTAYAKAIADNSIFVLTTPYTLEAIAENADVDYNSTELAAMVKATQIDTLSAIKVEVTSSVAGEAEIIANSVVRILPEGIARVVGDDSISISEYTVSPETETITGKNPVKMALIGAVVGAFIAAGIIMLKVIFSDPIIYNASQLCALYPELPVLADGNKGFDYAAANLLNIASCEGFSLAYTAVEDAGLGALELASAIAAFGRKVLLVDAELYGRQISMKAALADNTGFKELVSGELEFTTVVHRCENLDIIPTGKVAENIVATLADKKMAQLLQNMKSDYDFVIVNLPAVGKVADSLPAIKLMDGVVLSLAENKSTIKESDGCVEQLMRTGTKLIGLIVN